MNNIVIRVNNGNQSIAEHQVITQDGTPTVIQAADQVNYEIIDQDTGVAPQHLITQRQGEDLVIYFDADAQEAELIIENYYASDSNSALIGQAENGGYYYYIPDTGEVADFVTELAPGDIEGQALGGPEQATPWWIGTSGLGWLPWVAGLLALGGIAAALADGGSDDSTPAPESVADVNVESLDNIPPSAEDEDGSSIITGSAEPNTNVVIKDSDGNIVGQGRTDADGNFTIETETPLADGEKYDVIAQDESGNQIGDKDTITGDLTDPITPDLIAHEDGSVTAEPVDENAIEMTVEYTDENEQPQTVTVEKGEDGKWEPANGTTLPEGVTLDPDTGKVTLTPDAVKDGSEVTAEVKDHFEQDSSASTNAGHDIVDKPDAPDLIANPDGSVEMTPTDDATDATVDFTDENGEQQHVEINKDPETGAWTPVDDNELPDGVAVDPDTGTVTIEPDAVEDGSTVTAENSNEDGTSGAEVTAGDDDPTTDDLGPEAPELVANPDGSVEMTPADDATDATLDYTDEDGNDQTVDIVKDPTDGTWGPADGTELPDGVTVEPDTGTVTIPPDAVEDGSTVTAENSNDNGSSSAEVEAGNDIEDITPPAAPEIVANVDGSVTATPDQEDAVDLTVDFTDENDQPQKVEIIKDPTTGEWVVKDGTELPDGVTVDPATGQVTLAPDAVKDGSEVIASNSDEHGNTSSSQATAAYDPVDDVDPGDNGIPGDVDGDGDVDDDDDDATTIDGAPIITFPEDVDGNGMLNVAENGDTKETTPVQVSTPAKTEPGDTVVVTINGVVQEIPVTADDITNGYVTVDAPIADADNDGTIDNIVVEAYVKDPAGNQSNTATETLVVDLVVPGDSDGDGSADEAGKPVVTIADGEDGEIDPADLNDDGTVNVTIDFPADSGYSVGDIVTITKPDGSTEEVTLTDELISNGLDTTFTPLPEGENNVVTAVVKDPAGNASLQGKDESITDLIVPGDSNGDGTPDTAPVVSITEDTNNDGFISADELDGLIDVTVEMPVNTQVGDKITVFNPNGSNKDYVVTQDVLNTGLKITYPQSDFPEGKEITVSAVVKDASGNTTPQGSDSATVDTKAPSAPSVSIGTDGNDVITADEIDANGNVEVTVGLPDDAQVGDIVTVNGAQLEPLTPEQINAGAITTTVAVPAEGKTLDVEATITDAAGNESEPGNSSATVDIIVPGDSDGDGVSDKAPIVTIKDVNDDGHIDSEDLNADGSVTTTITFPADAGYSVGDTLTVTKPDGSTQQFELTEDNLSKGVTVTFKPLAENQSNVVTAVVTDPQGNESLEGSDTGITDLVFPNDAPVVSILEDANNDEFINAKELSGTIDVKVTLPADTAIGDIVSVTGPDGSKDYTVTEYMINNGLLINYDQSLVAEGDNVEVTAIIKDAADNVSAEGKDNAVLDTKVNTPTVTPNTDDGGIVIDPPADDDVASVSVTYQDESGNIKEIVATKNTAGTWEITNAPDGVSVDGATGQITLDENAVKDGATVTAIASDQAGNDSAPATGIAGEDNLVPGDSDGDGQPDAAGAPVVEIADGGDEYINLSELNDDGMVNVTITLPADSGYEVDDVMTITKPDGSTETITLTAEHLTNGVTTTFTPIDGEKNTVTAVVADAEDPSIESTPGSDSTTVDLIEPTAPTVQYQEDNSPDDGLLTLDEYVAGNADNADEITVNITVPEDVKAGDVLTVTNPDGTTTNYPITQQMIDDAAAAADPSATPPVEPNIVISIDYPITLFPYGVGQAVTAKITDVAGNVSSEASDSLMNVIEAPEITVDLQDYIDATDDPADPNDNTIYATVSGTTDAPKDSEVQIVVQEYNEKGQPIGPTVETTAIVTENGTYSVEVDVTILANTDNTGDEVQDKHTIGAVATVTTISGTGSATDLLSEKAVKSGLNIEDDPVQGLFDTHGLNNDMSLLYGPSKKYMILKDSREGTAYTIGEDTSFGDPLLFTNYDDTFIINNRLTIFGNNYPVNAPNDGGVAANGSTDGARSRVTVDTGQGDDIFSVTRINNNVGARVYMGEGDDSFITSNNYLGTNNYVYTESGDDTVRITGNLGGRVYAGSGGDDVTILGQVDRGAIVDLGSGLNPADYASEYVDASKLSLGNDDNIDAPEDENTLYITQDLKGRIFSDKGQDTITVDGDVSGVEVVDEYTDGGRIYSGDNKDTILVKGSVTANGRVDAGAGDDTININTHVTGTADTTNATGLTAEVSGGSGNDTITIGENSVGVSVYNARLLGGQGNDTMQIDGIVTYEAYVGGGSGNDKINVDDAVVERAIVDGNEGNDELTINQVGNGLSRATVIGGDGEDIITIGSLENGNSEIFTGDAESNEDLAVDVVNIDAFENGTVHLGKDDVIKLTDMNSGQLNLSNFDDEITLGGDPTTIDGSHIQQLNGGRIFGGEGEDTLHVAGSGLTLTSNDIFAFEVVDLGKGADNAGNTFESGYIRDYNAQLEESQPMASGEKALLVKGDLGDFVDLGSESNSANDPYYDGIAARSWSQTAVGVEIDGTTYNVWSQDGSSYGGPSSIYIEDGIVVI